MIRYLIPPTISEAHIQEKIVCIRAHRERIFNVSTQIQKNKLICHNYGQGGAGWTFLFGCVHESLRQFEQALKEHPEFKPKAITVIGAGCYGLLTAIMLTRKGYAIRIIAAETKNIPSYKAAGFFFPRARKSSTPIERALFESYGVESYVTYQQIINGIHPFLTTGARILPAYFGRDIDPGFSPYRAQGLIPSPQPVTIDFGNGKQYEAHEYKSLFIDTKALMQQLQALQQSLNIPLTQCLVNAFDECEDQIIFNCAGLGAQSLTADPRIVPVQGHLITLKNQPPLDQLQYMINVKVTQRADQFHKKSVIGTVRDELIYYAPKESGILGITFIRGQADPTKNHYEFARLIERSQKFFGT